MRELRHFIVLMVFAFLGVATVTAATLFGSVTDATGESLPQASVRVLAARDSSLVKAVVTGSNGRFTVSGIKKGRYIVEASYVGFEAQTRPVTVGDKDVRLKPFALSEGAIALKEAVVTGIKTPIKVMEDTVEFNADSYKTQPNAVVEDLVKRLPGAEVDSEGKITINGKEIKKILVDGKDFFSDDPTVASRNLPVNMVDKLQVVDRKSDLARLTGVDDGDDETVINLTVKKGMNNGWFGNAEAGYGTDDRYKGTFIVNRFWNGNQLTILGGANNVNDPGFADGASGRFRRFGGSNGITSSQSLGLNFNVGNGEIFRVGGDVLYSHTDRNTITSSDRQYLFTDSTSTQRSNKHAKDRGHNIRGDFRMQWKPDSFNTFEFRPNFSLNYNDSWSTDSSSTFAGGRSAGRQVTRSLNRSNSDGHSFEFGGTLTYNHNFRQRRGRSFSVWAQYQLSNVRENAETYSFNKFFLLNDSVDLYDQFANNHTWSNSVAARLTWTEPLGDPAKGNFLTLAYRFSYRWNNADKMTYDHPVTFPDGWEGDPLIAEELVFNPELSNSFRNDYMNQDIRLGYRHVSKKGNLNAGISLVPQMSKSINLLNHDKDIPRRNVLNFAPFLRYRYKFSKASSIMLRYNGRSSQPSMSQLQPVADMSDPLRIVIGNPDLKPTFTHSAMLRYHNFNSEAQRSVMAMFDAQFQQNSIVSKTTFDPTTGGQTTTYTNVNGVWNVRAMNMVSFPFRNKAFTFNNHIMLSYSNTEGFNNGERNSSGTFTAGESFGLAWRPENLELELRPNYRISTVHNSFARQSDRTTHTYGGSFYGSYTLPFGLTLGTDLNYSATSGYSQGYDTKTWMWNASLSYEFLRNRAATVSLKAYDILGQRSNVRRSVTANYIDDSRYNSLTRYVMVTVSYRFNTFGKGQQPADRNGHGEFGPPPGAPRPPRGAGGGGRPF